MCLILLFSNDIRSARIRGSSRRPQRQELELFMYVDQFQTEYARQSILKHSTTCMMIISLLCVDKKGQQSYGSEIHNIIIYNKRRDVGKTNHAVTSLNSQRPSDPNDPELDKKLHFLLDHIMNNPVQVQFKAYHELQSPQLQLNQNLKQIYQAQSTPTDNIISIIKFYAFLLTNCHNQLVLCKLVSDPFVLALTEVRLKRLSVEREGIDLDLQQINSYKIALIKAYVSKIGEQTIKYMVLGDRMRIFQNCVRVYQQFMLTEQSQFCGVEETCISNCILLLVQNLIKHQEYPAYVCLGVGELSVGYLLVSAVHKIHSQLQTVLSSHELDEQLLQSIRSRIFFLIDMINSITHGQYRKQLIERTGRELKDLRQLFKGVVDRFSEQLSQKQYECSIQVIKAIIRLLSLYYSSQNLRQIYLKSLPSIFNQCIHRLTIGLVKSTKKYKPISKVTSVFCCNMQIVSRILDGAGLTKRTYISNTQQKELTILFVNRLVDIIQIILSDQESGIEDYICCHSIRLLMLSLMHLTLQNEHTLHEYSVLKFHQRWIERLRNLLKHNQEWDYVVEHYESLMKNATEYLLATDSPQTQEFIFCQFHDRPKSPTLNDLLTNTIFIVEYLRNFRFMIVAKTYVRIEDVKLQKTYHLNFMSAGWQLEPGIIVEDPPNCICHLLHISNTLKIPVQILQDEECLILAHGEEESNNLKVLCNIRYKSIEGFTIEKNTIRVRLKGRHQVLLEIDKNKQDLQKFKHYLINKRDKSRQRELTFIHSYLELYHRDNQRIIDQMGQEEIEFSPLKQQKSATIEQEYSQSTLAQINISSEKKNKHSLEQKLEKESENKTDKNVEENVEDKLDCDLRVKSEDCLGKMQTGEQLYEQMKTRVNNC